MPGLPGAAPSAAWLRKSGDWHRAESTPVLSFGHRQDLSYIVEVLKKAGTRVQASSHESRSIRALTPIEVREPGSQSHIDDVFKAHAPLFLKSAEQRNHIVFKLYDELVKDRFFLKKEVPKKAQVWAFLVLLCGCDLFC